ncbi:hypothetical protein FRX31_018657, partial [Thalictrum thalictroides]
QCEVPTPFEGQMQHRCSMTLILSPYSIGNNDFESVYCGCWCYGIHLKQDGKYGILSGRAGFDRL